MRSMSADLVQFQVRIRLIAWRNAHRIMWFQGEGIGYGLGAAFGVDHGEGD